MSSVSATSGAPLAAAAPAVLTPDVVRSWGATGVKQWAMTVDGITEVHADILVAQEIDGAALLLVTKEELMADGMKRGPALLLMNAVAAIKEAGGTAPTDGGAGGGGAGGAGAGAGACGWGGG